MTSFTGRRIMIVEDSFYLAMEMESVLEDAGADVIGPFATSQSAMDSLKEGSPPDCAVLDVNLSEGNSFDLARALRMRGVPFLFFTGYDRNALPAEFVDVERLEKPIDSAHMLSKLAACCLPEVDLEKR